MKKLLFLLIPFLILLFAQSCTETPTEVQNNAEIPSDMHDLYLKKLKGRPNGPTFEEFKALYAKQRPMKKNLTTVSATPPEGWDPDYGENLYLDWESSIDITDPGEVNNPVPDDFDFKFYGMDYNQIYANANGNITIDRDFYGVNDIDIATSTTSIIAPLAGDFDPEDDSENNVYFKVTGDAPNRVLVITWVNVLEAIPVLDENNIEQTNTFQLKLFEGTDNIQFAYNGLSTSGYDNGYGEFYPQDVGIGSSSGQNVVVAVGYDIQDLDGTNVCISPSPDPTVYEENPGLCGSVEPTPTVPVDQILAAKLALKDLLSGPELEKKLKKATENAIKDIDKSLDPKNWIDDTTPDPKHGKKVFDHLKKAVKDLKKFEKAKGASIDQKLAIEGVISQLVAICRGFVEDALAELDPLYCDTGKCGKERGKALKEMDKAEEEITKRHWDHAIDKYKKAWEHALKALKHYNNEKP